MDMLHPKGEFVLWVEGSTLPYAYVLIVRVPLALDAPTLAVIVAVTFTKPAALCVMVNEAVC